MGEFLSAANKDKHSHDGENDFVNKNYLIIMGEFLSSPNKEKHSQDGENSIVSNRKNYIIKILIVKIWFI